MSYNNAMVAMEKLFMLLRSPCYGRVGRDGHPPSPLIHYHLEAHVGSFGLRVEVGA